MNILAEKQKIIIEPGLPEEERRRREKEFLRLYFYLRQRDETSFLGRLSLKTRRRIHKLVLLVYILKNRLSGFSYELIGDKCKEINRPIIYAVTHIGKFDIEVISEAIKDHFYLLSGDYEHLQGTVAALFLAINGVLYFNEYIQEDRASVSERMIAHLKAGGNLMYFPEGTWNMTPNLPMLPCYWGIVKIAQESNSVIVPVAADQYGKKFKINIGKHFDMSKFGNTKEEKSKAITALRDTLSSLKWEIWETKTQRRSELSGNEWERYCGDRFKEWPYFNMEYIDGLVFKPKGGTPPSDVFAHLDKLRPSRNNAFLINKRNHN